jgi:hypothetical protein
MEWFQVVLVILIPAICLPAYLNFRREMKAISEWRELAIRLADNPFRAHLFTRKTWLDNSYVNYGTPELYERRGKDCFKKRDQLTLGLIKPDVTQVSASLWMRKTWAAPKGALFEFMMLRGARSVKELGLGQPRGFRAKIFAAMKNIGI